MVFEDFCCVAFAEYALFKVLASFADCHCFVCFLMHPRQTEETAMVSFNKTS